MRGIQILDNLLQMVAQPGQVGILHDPQRFNVLEEKFFGPEQEETVLIDTPDRASGFAVLLFERKKALLDLRCRVRIMLGIKTQKMDKKRIQSTRISAQNFVGTREIDRTLQFDHERSLKERRCARQIFCGAYDEAREGLGFGLRRFCHRFPRGVVGGDSDEIVQNPLLRVHGRFRVRQALVVEDQRHIFEASRCL